MNYELQEIQREGRNKSTLVNRTYIESGKYRKKFDSISNDATLNRIIYQIAKSMLYHRNGTRLEDMYWIDVKRKCAVAREINQIEPEKITYSKKTLEMVRKHRGLLTVHSHPNSYPPSIEDFNSNYENEYAIGIVCCHDGKVYMYSSNQYVNVTYYRLLIEKFLREGYNDMEAQCMALEKLKENFDITWKELF